jgi:hypothetical protein
MVSSWMNKFGSSGADRAMPPDRRQTCGRLCVQALMNTHSTLLPRRDGRPSLFSQFRPANPNLL